MTDNVVRLPGTEHFLTANPRGEVIIYPCPLDNGSWAVEHVSQTGEPLALLSAYFSSHKAETAARQKDAAGRSGIRRQRSAMTRREVDPAQIASFVDAIFRHASDGQIISLRTFEDCGGSKPLSIHPVEVNGAGLKPVTEAAVMQAHWAADHSRKTVFCPPLAGFSSREEGRRTRILQKVTRSRWNAMNGPTRLGKSLNPCLAHQLLWSPQEDFRLIQLQAKCRRSCIYIGGSTSLPRMVTYPG